MKTQHVPPGGPVAEFNGRVAAPLTRPVAPLPGGLSGGNAPQVEYIFLQHLVTKITTQIV